MEVKCNNCYAKVRPVTLLTLLEFSNLNLGLETGCSKSEMRCEQRRVGGDCAVAPGGRVQGSAKWATGGKSNLGKVNFFALTIF